MNDKPINGNVAEFPIIFDVKNNEHYVLAENIQVAITSTEDILKNLNEQFFDGRLKYELRDYGAKEGSAIADFAIVVMGGVAVNILTPVIKHYLQSLYKGVMRKYLDINKIGKHPEEVIRDMVIGIYLTSIDKLKSILKSNKDLKDSKKDSDINLNKAIMAKSAFYRSCKKNPDIRRLSFDKRQSYIPKNQFPEHIGDVIEPLNLIRRLEQVIIDTSVNVNKDDDWKFEIIKGKYNSTGKGFDGETILKARMRDEHFRQGHLNGTYPLKETEKDDELTVLIEYQREEKNGEEKITKRSIVKVYKFNNQQIAPIPPELINNQRDMPPPPPQVSKKVYDDPLFDEIPTKKKNKKGLNFSKHILGAIY